MNKKIDFFIKNNKDKASINNNTSKSMVQSKKADSGSKTVKKTQVKQSSSSKSTGKTAATKAQTCIKKRGRRPKKILEDIDTEDTAVDDDSNDENANDDNKDDDESIQTSSAVIVRMPFNPASHVKKASKAGSKSNKSVNVDDDVSDSEDIDDTLSKRAVGVPDTLSNRVSKTGAMDTLSKRVSKTGAPDTLDKTKCNKSKGSKTAKSKGKKILDSDNNSDDEDSSEGMFRNDIPRDNICMKCVKNEKSLALIRSKLDKYEKKEKNDNSNKFYNNKISFISLTNNKKVIIENTGIKCWWDTNSFTNLPCFLPELFHNDTYHVRGCFCSFNCALAYNLYYIKDSKVHHRKSLVYKLYRELYGLSADDIVDIREAPPKEILDDFGGEMTIKTFRKTFLLFDKEYIQYIPPIKPLNMLIEERNVNNVNDYNDSEYVIKRSKPLAKKRSVIASMGIKMDN